MKTIFKLFYIHCGFYDHEIGEGIYEFHVNIPIVAETLIEAKKRVRKNPLFLKKQMHIDGIQELKIVDGYRMELIPDNALELNKTIVLNHLHRDL